MLGDIIVGACSHPDPDAEISYMADGEWCRRKLDGPVVAIYRHGELLIKTWLGAEYLVAWCAFGGLPLSRELAIAEAAEILADIDSGET
jgi:hypothetical protein